MPIKPILSLFFNDPASQITPDLWQGGYPADPTALKDAGFGVIVLAAKELQQDEFPDLEVIYAPLDDVPQGPSPEEVLIAVNAANQVLTHLREGHRVLVTCAAGRNRSGLVNALVLVARYGVSGHEAAAHIRSRRPTALTNPGFSAFLDKIPERRTIDG